MDTKSTYAKTGGKNHYALGSSRRTRSVTTLLAQVEDIERGQRIKARREDLRLTQPAVVDLVEKLAYELPDDHPVHPDNAGKPPLTLRGYQQYERGGGIAWEKAKLLATALRLDVEEMMNGPKPETPQLFAVPGQASDGLSERLDAIDKRLAEIEDVLTRLADAATARSAESARQQLATGQERRSGRERRAKAQGPA